MRGAYVLSDLSSTSLFFSKASPLLYQFQFSVDPYFLFSSPLFSHHLPSLMTIHLCRNVVKHYTWQHVHTSCHVHSAHISSSRLTDVSLLYPPLPLLQPHYPSCTSISISTLFPPPPLLLLIPPMSNVLSSIPLLSFFFLLLSLTPPLSYPNY